MSKVKLIAENTGFLVIGNVASKVISLFAVILIARYLGDVGYGKYSFVFAFISFYSIVSELGILQILVREISRDPEIAGKMIGNAILIKTVLSVLAFIAAIFSINKMGYPEETIIAVQIAALVLLVDTFNTYGVIYEVNLKMKYSIFFLLISRLLMLGLIVLIIHFDLGLNLIILATVAASAIQNFFTFLFSTRYIKVKFDLDFQVCKYLVKNSLPLALSSVFTIIYYRIDTVMLSMMVGDAAVGIYSAAYRISETFIFIPSILMTSIFPLMSKSFENSNEILAFSYEKSIKYLFSLALPMAVGTTILSDKIMLTIYGDGFRGSIIALQILIWATAIIFINYATSNFFVSINKQKFVMFFTGVGVIINVLLNLILIPKYGYGGASIATVLTELSTLIITFYRMPPVINRKKLINQNYSSVIATIIMASFLLSGVKDYLGLLIVIPSAVIYFISYYVFKGVDVDDKNIFMKVFGKYI
ncbi:MAG: flippase [Methanosarcina sp.]|uniref:flippase n=1 Tax=Methanosarcina sp. TaxID=2213 RepID=UPI002629A301|nr:flippase [Methanosarcina sp.]MDD3245965.1 flippase [Methanosarcina sp.]MDD4247605.1 flippase [Methanosarcina sp.]